MTDDHALYTDILRTRALASYLLAQLEEEIHRCPDAKELSQKYWGKSDVLSVLIKLSMMLLKYIPLEKNMRAAPVADEEADALTSEEIEAAGND